MRRALLFAAIACVLVYSAMGTSLAAEKVTLNVWSSPDNADALHDLATQYTKQNPDVKIQVTPLSWEFLYPKILQDVATGTGAFDVTTWDVMTAGAVAKGMVDLQEFRKAHPEAADPDYDWNDYDKMIWKTWGVWNGVNIGLPFYPASMLFFYRKDYFEDPKIKVKFKAKYGRELTIPKTWEETIQIAEFFTRKYNSDSPTEYGIALMFPRTHTLFYMYPIFFAPYRRSAEGISKFGEVNPDYGDYFTHDGKPAFNTREGVKAINIMKKLMSYAPDPLGSDYGETLEYFSNGTVAMVPQWFGVWASFVASEKLKPIEKTVGVANMPGGHPVSGGWALGLNKASNHKIEAFKFMQFATNKNNDKYKFLKYGLTPARISTTKDPKVQNADARMDVFAEALAKASHRPRIPEEPKLEDVAVNVLSGILMGSIDPEEGLNRIAKEWIKILED